MYLNLNRRRLQLFRVVLRDLITDIVQMQGLLVLLHMQTIF
jgi:hypothetical protein